MRPSSRHHVAAPLLLAFACFASACSDPPVQPALNVAVLPATSLFAERSYQEISLAPMVLPAAINSAGQVVGDCGGPGNGCLWENGRVTYLGGMSVFLGMPLEDNDVLNDAGQVIGVCWTPNMHACRWDRAHGVIDLGAGPESYPVAINATGDVVGAYAGPANYPGFLWRNGALIDLSFTPQGINARGQVVGGVYPHAFFWENGVTTDLGTLGGAYAEAVRINAAGQVAGLSSTGSEPYTEHVFVWDHDTMIDIARGSSVLEHLWRPVQINARGQVVSNDFLSDGVPGAWVWERGTRTFLSSLKGPRTYQATALSATGLITGWYSDPPCTDATHSGCSGFQRPFISDGTTVIDLPITRPVHDAWGLAVNARGQVVGLRFPEAVLWTPTR